MNLHPSWKAYFENLESNETRNKQTSALSTATTPSATTTTNNLIRALTDDEDVVIMLVIAITKKIKLIHSVKNLGGSRLNPNNKIVGLDGFSNSAIPILIDEDSLTSKVEMRAPAFDRLKAVSSINDLSRLHPPSAGQKNFHHAPFVLLPPFIANIFTSSDDRDPSQLFINCNNALYEFDNTHSDDSDYDNIYEECKNILTYLWAASKKAISPTNMILGHDDPDVMQWQLNRHRVSIASTQTPFSPSNGIQNNEMLQSLAISIENQTSLVESMRQEKQEEKIEKQNKYLELHDTTKRLIRNASSDDGVDCPEEPNEHCIEFYNKKTVSKAMDYLIMTLTYEFKCCVTVDVGLVTSLFPGHFLRNRSDSPSNFSFFLVPRQEPMGTNHLKPSIILQLKAVQGKGWSDLDLKDALKQGISTPSDITTFSHQLRNYLGLASFFFGEKSIISKRLTQLIEELSEHTMILEAAQCRDHLFATKVGYLIDTKVFRWLHQCQAKETRELVKDKLIDFESIIDDILSDTFYQQLPTTMKQFDPKSENDNQHSNSQQRPREHSDRRENKRPRVANNMEQATKILNSKPISEWNLSPDDFQRFVSGKHLQKRPMLNGKPMCTRYHSKFYCFDNCRNKATHIPSNSLPETTKKAYSEFIKLCLQQ